MIFKELFEDRSNQKKLLEKGIESFKSENYSEAIKIFDSVLEINNQNEEANGYKAQSLLSLKLYEECNLLCTNYLQKKPNHFLFHFLKGDSLHELSRDLEALPFIHIYLAGISQSTGILVKVINENYKLSKNTAVELHNEILFKALKSFIPDFEKLKVDDDKKPISSKEFQTQMSIIKDLQKNQQFEQVNVTIFNLMKECNFSDQSLLWHGAGINYYNQKRFLESIACFIFSQNLYSYDSIKENKWTAIREYLFSVKMNFDNIVTNIKNY